MILMIDNYGQRGFREALLRARERRTMVGAAGRGQIGVSRGELR